MPATWTMLKKLFTPLAALVLLGAGCSPKPTQQVVLYCSVDEVFARPLIEKLEQETGVSIQVLYDVEAAKTAGLANKLRAETARPRADIFWSSALLQTQMLASEGVLAAYQPPAAREIPAAYRDPGGMWTAMGVRPRIMVSHRPAAPRALSALPDVTRGEKLALANPQFGTTSDWTACYAAAWGQKATLKYFADLKQRGARVLPGNADVALAVANGHVDLGITDSDDFLSQQKHGKSILLVKTTSANVLVPGTVALVKGAPHETAAKKVVDVLTSAAFENQLVQAMPGVFSIRSLETQAAWQASGIDFTFLKKGLVPFRASTAQDWKAIRQPLARELAP